MMGQNDGEAAGFFLQQSLEKYLKAFLLAKGWKLKKIHELDVLLDEAIKFNKDLDVFYPLCEKVAGYYFSERYPSIAQQELSVEEVQEDLDEAKQLIKAIIPEKAGKR